MSRLAPDARSLGPLTAAQVFLLVFLVAGLILVLGYAYPTDNHSFEVPPILALMHPELYARDFVVQEMQQFTPRSYYNHLIAFFAGTGLGITGALFLAYTAALTSFLGGLVAIGRWLFGHWLAVAVFCFWVFACTVATLGANDLFRAGPYPPGGYPSVLATAVAVWGIYFSTRAAWVPAYAFFGAAALLQFLVGFLAGALLIPVLLAHCLRNRSWRTAVSALAVFAIGIGAVYFPMVLQGTTGTALLTDREFVELYGYVRHPHHIVPSHWPGEHWVSFLLFHAGALVCIWKSASIPREIRIAISAVIGLTVAALAVNYLFVEVFPSALIAKLQLARTTPFAKLAALIGLAMFFAEHARKGNWVLCAILVVIPVSHQPGLLLLLFALSTRALEGVSIAAHRTALLWLGVLLALSLYVPPDSSGFFAWANWILEGPVLLALFVVPLLLYKWLENDPRRTTAFGGLAVTAAVVIGVGIGGLYPGPADKLFARQVSLDQPLERKRGDKELPEEILRLALRMNELAPTDSLFLVPPSLQKFSLLSRRSVVVAFKRFPYTDAGIVEWRGRMQEVLGVPVAELKGFGSEFDEYYRRRTPEELYLVAGKYGADYMLTTRDWHPGTEELEVAHEGDWVVLEIPKQYAGARRP